MMTVGYALLISLVLLAYVFYLRMAGREFSEQEIRELEILELNLGQILRLLDAPDVQMLLERNQSRRRIFREFSADLKDDVAKIIRAGYLSPAGRVYAFFFYVSYYLFRLKAVVFCGHNDLPFLAGITFNAVSRRT
ncbi:MAG: hypothetical protein HY645_08040 [Acidobacteria bacterium]|nr:hypothetical protein [Acidobacteriota bacterium]